MEAATLRRGGATRVRSLGEAVRARSGAFWILAGLTVAAAVLRFITLGVQSYHHDEVVTAGRILRGSFGHAMDTVGVSESTPPLYYALAWFWTQATANTEFGLRSLSALAGVATVPVVYLIATELRGRRAGLLAAALAAFNPMLLWYSQEARAYSLLVLLCAVSMLFCFRALRRGRRRDFLLWGLASGLALATHYFAVFPILAEAALLIRRRGVRAATAGFAIVLLSALALAPLAIHQMSSGHAEWISSLSLGHRVWETVATFVSGETGDIIGQPERPELAYVPLALCLAAFALLAFRAGREERRAARWPLAVGLAAVAIPIAVALVDPGKDFVLARNLMPGLIPLLIVVAIAATLPSARRLGAVLGAALLAYSVGFCVWVSVSPELQRPNWDSVAGRLGEPTQPRATVTWTIGEAPLRYYLPTNAIQVRHVEGYDWLVHEVDFISQGEVPPPAPKALGPAFHETGAEMAGSLQIRRYAVPGRGLAPVHLGTLRLVPLNFRTTGVLLDGIGPR
jgi:4-amino-4-deoxy-L-arabinose transferase-like glycosyltransferase